MPLAKHNGAPIAALWRYRGQVTSPPSRDHLEHLPGRTFLLSLAIATALIVVVAASQLIGAENSGDSVLWAIVTGIGALSLLALGVAWEERGAHVHALVREASRRRVSGARG